MKVVLFTLLMLLVGCAPLSVNESPNHQDESERDDYYTVVSSLLNTNQDRFTFSDVEGKEHLDQLRLFKELEAVYIRYVEPKGDGVYSKEQVKIVMFFAFYAQNRQSGAFNEYLASDLNPLYSKNKTIFLEVMSELPFLIPPVCNRLNAYFGFEGKNATAKEDFIIVNMTALKAHLTQKEVDVCLAQFAE